MCGIWCWFLKFFIKISTKNVCTFIISDAKCWLTATQCESNLDKFFEHLKILICWQSIRNEWFLRRTALSKVRDDSKQHFNYILWRRNEYFLICSQIASERMHVHGTLNFSCYSHSFALYLTLCVCVYWCDVYENNAIGEIVNICGRTSQRHAQVHSTHTQ